MSAKIPVCILGATGTVGQKFVRLLADHPWFEIAAVAASAASAGKRYGDVVRWREQWRLPAAIGGSDRLRECAPPLPGAIAFSALDAEVAGPIEQAFARAGAYVVTNTRTHRMEPDVPLLIPEANADHLVLIDRQREARGLERRDPRQPQLLHRGPRARARAAAPRVRRSRSCSSPRCRRSRARDTPACLRSTSLGNVIPHIGGEEEKIERESRKILGALGPAGVEPADFAVSAHTNRVAVRRRPPGDGLGRVPPAGDAGRSDRGRCGVSRLAVRGRLPSSPNPPGRGGRPRPTGRNPGSISSAGGGWR